MRRFRETVSVGAKVTSDGRLTVGRDLLYYV